jgi:hypothetical protein
VACTWTIKSAGGGLVSVMVSFILSVFMVNHT